MSGVCSLPVLPPDATTAASGVRNTVRDTPPRSGGSPARVGPSKPITSKA